MLCTYVLFGRGGSGIVVEGTTVGSSALTLTINRQPVINGAQYYAGTPGVLGGPLVTDPRLFITHQLPLPSWEGLTPYPATSPSMTRHRCRRARPHGHHTGPVSGWTSSTVASNDAAVLTLAASAQVGALKLTNTGTTPTLDLGNNTLNITSGTFLSDHQTMPITGTAASHLTVAVWRRLPNFFFTAT